MGLCDSGQKHVKPFHENAILHRAAGEQKLQIPLKPVLL